MTHIVGFETKDYEFSCFKMKNFVGRDSKKFSMGPSIDKFYQFSFICIYFKWRFDHNLMTNIWLNCTKIIKIPNKNGTASTN